MGQAKRNAKNSNPGLLHRGPAEPCFNLIDNLLRLGVTALLNKQLNEIRGQLEPTSLVLNQGALLRDRFLGADQIAASDEAVKLFVTFLT